MVRIDCAMVGGGWGGRVSLLARHSVATLVWGLALDTATEQHSGSVGGGGGGEDDKDDDNKAGGVASPRGRGSPLEDPLVLSGSKELRGGRGRGG